MQLTDLADKRVVVWGAGREGRSAVEAIQRFEINAHVSVIDDVEGAPTCGPHRVLRGNDKIEALDRAEVIIRSPGVSRYRDDIAEYQSRGVVFTTPTRLWFAEGFTNVIGITGTKGKSTTASLTAALLTAAGYNVELSGNIGRNPLEQLGRANPDWWVVELSSYQTSDLDCSPAVGVLTSLSPEHLDWHRNESNYRRDKLNLFAHNNKASVIVNGADPGARAASSEINANIIMAGEAPAGRVNDGFFQIGDFPVASTSAFQLLGRHNHHIASVALTVLDTVGVDIAKHADAVAHTLSTFEPLAHRLEVVDEVNGVSYVDDSIATTPAATIAALSAFEGHPIIVLVGGYDRGLSYEELARFIERSHGRIGVVALPDSGARITNALNDAGCSNSAIHTAANVQGAVEIASDISSPGGVVLLSPGAPSFGLFNNYIERGNAFRSAVAALRLSK